MPSIQLSNRGLGPLAVLAAITVIALGAGPSAGQPRSAAAPVAGPDIAALAGVYKHHFRNGLVSGETFTSEDIVEVVPTGPASAYFRAHLEFYNGHECALSGIAHVEKGVLTYHAPAKDQIPGEAACVLTIARRGPSLRLDDGEGTCKGYCGMRGSFSDYTIPAASRRPIRYMARLKASEQYRDALAEDH